LTPMPPEKSPPPHVAAAASANRPLPCTVRALGYGVAVGVTGGGVVAVGVG